jgi:hypothetical protein
MIKFSHFFFRFRLKFKHVWIHIKKFVFGFKFKKAQNNFNKYLRKPLKKYPEKHAVKFLKKPLIKNLVVPLEEHDVLISKYRYNKAVLGLMRNKIKRRPRLLTVILSFLYLINLQVLDLIEEFYCKKTKLELLIRLDSGFEL